MLRAEKITKRFGDLVANDALDLAIDAGEIRALLGENGAGKSTLVKVLYGALQPDSGRIIFDEEVLRIANPSAARALGIGMVFQHFSLFEALTVAENIALALPSGRGLAEIARDLKELSARYGLPLDPATPVGDLSVGERQRVEIVRCLMQDPKLIILDEPTSVLTPQESDELFAVLRRLAEEGRAILFISHKLDEVRRLCHSATILRHGKLIGTCDPRKVSKGELSRMMVGEAVADIEVSPPMLGETALELRGLSMPAAGDFSQALHDINLIAPAGLVTAIAGVAGNGQSELFDAISGERLAPDDDMILRRGRPMGHYSINTRRFLGAAFVSEERLGHGAVPSFSLSENVILTHGVTDAMLARRGIIDWSTADDIREDACESFDVRRGVPNPAAGSLSGGNLQKFVVGREVVRQPDLLVINQPTWGVDAAAAAHIRATLSELARKGATVVVISQDLDEIFEIADQVAVLSEGRLSELIPRAELDREHIGLLMAGETSEAVVAA
ncbi:MAG: ABC transporter ATP-binding protein [Pseudomonadota bacterium]